jgi:exodeoxyribonuclease V alpha subunit
MGFLTNVLELSNTASRNIVNSSIEIDSLLSDKELLMTIPGIRSNKVEQIMLDWIRNKRLVKLSNLLTKHKFTGNAIKRIDFELKPKYSKSDLVEAILNNPYILCSVKYITFDTVDEFAMNLNFDKSSPERIKAASLSVMSKEKDGNGNTCIEKDAMISKLSDLLKIDKESLKENITLNEYMHEECGYMGLSEDYNTEKYIYDFCNKNKDKTNSLKFKDKKDIVDYVKENFTDIELNELQEQALVNMLKHRVSVLNGYAGTGKSSLIRFLVHYIKNELCIDSEYIKAVALSGIAAKRLGNVININTDDPIKSQTIHSLLGEHQAWNFKSSSTRLDKIGNCKVIIVDECSMIDNGLFYSLIRAIPDKSMIIFIGDEAQLPPIGPAMIFKDIIQHELLNVNKLTKIYRQNERSVINIFAFQIRQGSIPLNYRDSYDDFRFINVSNESYYKLKNSLDEESFKQYRDNIHHIILNEIRNICIYHKKDIKDPITDLQVLLPTKKNPVIGSNIVNPILRDIFNPTNHQDENSFYRVKDKVIHIKNALMSNVIINNVSKTKKIYNGSLGLVESVDKKEIVVKYASGEIVTYDQFHQEYLELAYSLTVHKTQGSEFSIVIIPLSLNDWMMLNNQWLYTAITRAKKLVYIIGEREAFEMACKNNEIKNKTTWLPRLVDKEIKQ